MQKLNLKITINAPKEKVWDVLWNDKTYPEWTKVFMEGSVAVSDWKEGSRIQFMDGKGNGLYSTIVKKIPDEYMSFQHEGEMKNGIELPLDEKAKEWAGAMENYTLKETNGITDLIIEMDITDDLAQYFRDTYPKALDIIKALSEQ